MSFSHPALPWLLEEENPGVRYLALRDLVGLKQGDPELVKAQKQAYASGPIGYVFKYMKHDGYWVKPGAGYGPKYKSTVWSLILLSQLGASVNDDERIGLACTYYLDHAFSTDNSISYKGAPSGTIACLQGNMSAALTILGSEDERLERTYAWMAKSVIGRNMKYYAYMCGPCFACGANGKKPCAWGAVKVMLAFGNLPAERRTPIILEAIKIGAEFLLGIDPVEAVYPTRENTKPNRSWWKFGFPVFYVTDVLQIVEALVLLGYGDDVRLRKAIDYIQQKQDAQGRWALEYDYTGKSWGNYGEKGKPNKWVTCRVLKAIGRLKK